MIRKNNSHLNVVISINHILHDQTLKKSEKLLLKRCFCSNSMFNLLTLPYIYVWCDKHVCVRNQRSVLLFNDNPKVQYTI